MLTTLIVAFVVFALAALMMAVGVIFSGKRIQGSCGGLGAMRDENGESLCMTCSRRSDACPDGRNRKDGADRIERDAAV